MVWRHAVMQADLEKQSCPLTSCTKCLVHCRSTRPLLLPSRQVDHRVLRGEGRLMTINRIIALCCLLACACWPGVSRASSAADMISAYRSQHGEGRVTSDATLSRIAQEQASAMAAQDNLSHDALGSFRTRVGPANAGRAAENIAFGYDNFPKTLDQWINSSEHRKNLLLHGASRVGIAHARSASSGRTYWAMVIAGDYERRTPRAAGKRPAESIKTRTKQACHLKILNLCL